VFRVLLAGIHLMRTGHIKVNILRLNEGFHLPYLPDLIARKLTGSEQVALGEHTYFYDARMPRTGDALW
jgi:hypothetical protein